LRKIDIIFEFSIQKRTQIKSPFTISPLRPLIIFGSGNLSHGKKIKNADQCYYWELPFVLNI